MEHLPEDVLLTVMQYLDVPDLLACRLVCKRIGGLALHPHVWRRQRVSDHNRYLLPVLRLAPCLASLSVVLPADHQQLYSITRCAVSSLSLIVQDGSAVFAALVIANQEMLGRLRNLDVRYWAEETVADAPALLWPVAFTSGLVALAVSVSDRHEYVISTNSLPTARPRSSLRTFTCNLRPDLGPFCDFVLASHADTLEDVDLEGNCNFSTSALTSTASLLAGIPNLRGLYHCPLLPGLDAVAACESLELVSLGVGCSRMRDAVPQAKEFLRRAKQLRNVTLEYREEASINGVGVDLVLALVSSGPSLVESLTIDINEYLFSTFDLQPQLQPVISALPLMPALRELELDTASEALLLAITPATNPALRTIKLHPTESNAPRCAHGYLHWESVETLLSKNPSLDLIVYASYYCDELDPNACEPCELGCHGEVWESEWFEECAYMLEHGDDGHCTDWITIPRLNLSPVLIDSTATP
ncbi:uncharacterized protein LOC113207701 [Frankliniella occidentalis]|uniref:Uncharacterized protein LOC113207701 n=1 Tax=Frankliniella occidentalis TaxID=133901 RepID=A0A6J1SNK4_FRAOC|nr:uncharacterized protein LOC113207701 [Frankliniella occidentalis]XP_052120039.1 uncharacterized protein LOC113207701 [Frankliniella occidentalis]XP_052120042.1 uncharacterized protein LOC113207701 [Frankliniella occidentalis]